VIPDEWKCSNIVPILKSSHKVLASIYCPTSLLSTVSKIFEKHIYNIIFAHVETSCPLSPSQWGFLPGRSAGSALLTVTDEWHWILEQTAEVGATFFDDMVPTGLSLINSLTWAFTHISCSGWEAVPSK